MGALFQFFFLCRFGSGRCIDFWIGNVRLEKFKAGRTIQTSPRSLCIRLNGLLAVRTIEALDFHKLIELVHMDRICPTHPATMPSRKSLIGYGAWANLFA